MKRFNPLRASGAAALAILPVKDGQGHIVDAVVTAVVPEPIEPEPGRDAAPRRPRHSRRSRAARPDRLIVSTVTLTENEAKNGLQLHFPGKPDEATRAALKGAGWRWSFYNGCWYHRLTPENRQWAEQFIARTATAPAVEPVAPVAPEPANVIPLRTPNSNLPSPKRTPQIAPMRGFSPLGFKPTIVPKPKPRSGTVPLWRQRLGFQS